MVGIFAQLDIDVLTGQTSIVHFQVTWLNNPYVSRDFFASCDLDYITRDNETGVEDQNFASSDHTHTVGLHIFQCFHDVVLLAFLVDFEGGGDEGYEHKH